MHFGKSFITTLLMCDSYETFGDTKGIIRSRKTKNRQYNGQKHNPPQKQ